MSSPFGNSVGFCSLSRGSVPLFGMGRSISLIGAQARGNSYERGTCEFWILDGDWPKGAICLLAHICVGTVWNTIARF